MQFLDQFKNARRAAVPLVAVQTPDPAATISSISGICKDQETPILSWNIAGGLSGVNKIGKDTVAALTDKPSMLTNPTQMLLTAGAKLPEKSILFYFAPSRFFQEPSVVQAIWNLRDVFKGTTRTLVLLAPTFSLPAELSNDVLVLDEPLPTEEQIEEIVREAYSAAEIEPTKEDVSRAVDATIGIPAFPVEQSCYMSMGKNGLDFDYLWDRKRKTVGQNRALSIYSGPEKFSDIGGCSNVKNFIGSIIRDYRVIVFMDEIEKAVNGSGANGVTDSATTENVGALLSEMQDRKYDGILELGVPGAAKSAIAKAAGNEAGILTVVLDFSGMKQSLLGQTGENLRNALKTIYSISQGRALFIATCNSIEAISAELRRRFTLGTFFFDFPDEEERDVIWKIYRTKFSISPKDARPRDEKWTGAEIENCCKIARKQRGSLVDAAKYVVPVSISAADRIDALRRQADGRFISASYSGLYRINGPETETASRRKLATV